MNKIFTCTLFCILITCAAFSQKVSITWSAESKTENTYHSFVRGTENDLIKLCFEAKSRSILPVITRFNDKLQEQTTNNITVEEEGVKFDRFISIKNRLFFFTNIFDKKSKSTAFFCQPLDIKSLKFGGDNISLGSMAAVGKFSQSTVNYSLSKDSSKILMMGLTPYEKNASEKYYLAVYDNNMSKLWDNTIELPYKDKYISVLSKIVTNDGNVGVIIKHYNNETTHQDIRVDGKKVPSYTTKLLMYSKGEEKPYEFVIDIGNKFVQTLTIAEENGANITLFGMYQAKASGNVNGYFIANVNKDNRKVNLNNLNPFPEQLIELVNEDDQGSDKKKDSGLGNGFEFKKVVTRDNGDKDYLIELNQTVVTTRTSSSGTYTVTVHYAGDIIDIHVKPDGSNVLARIPKYQAGSSRLALGFETLVYKDKLLFFYNDHEKNIDKDLSKKPEMVVPEKRKNLAFTMASIDGNGNVSRTYLFGSDESKYTTATNVSFEVGKNKIALYAFKGGLFSQAKDMIGVLEVK